MVACDESIPSVLTIDMADYPAKLAATMGDAAPRQITAIGNRAALRQPTLAIFCSVACPGDIIHQLYDLAQALRNAGVTVISGFQSPMELECRWLLLRGQQPIIVCPARSITTMCVPSDLRASLAEKRLLLLSPFAPDERRLTKNLAATRNYFVAALADAVMIAHAAPGGQLAQLPAQVVAWEKPLLTLPSPHNAAIIEQGAQPVTPTNISAWWPIAR